MRAEEKVPNRIKALRRLKKITQKELGDCINVSSQVVSNWERGYTSSIEPLLLQRLADFFNVSVDYLLGRTDDRSLTLPIQSPEPKMPKDLKKILEQQEVMFSGTPLDEEDKQEILDIIQYHLYKRAKELNKRKPNK
ncbi:helix-turn-helix domain-containing protein [Sporomusa paucivorans]|uniref:helix-turn-helix domain-containing protein n=1 Tax=Sporomusa paucivorans TaxID=2376 RepID=UPI0035713394